MTIEEQITRLLLYASSDVNKLYDKLIKELSKVTATSTTRVTPDELYTIAKACTPSEKERVQALLDKYTKALQAVIQQGITLAVLHSANIQQKALAAYTRWEGKEVEQWRKDTANAFIRSRMKRDGGLNLSDRVWNYTQQTKGEFELAVSQVLEQGIGKGISAESLGRQVRQFLNNPDMMYRRYHMKKLMSDGTKKDVVEWRRRVVDEQGKVHFVKEDLAKVGTGVYRSSRQNALRLTITETNMAYNFANCERWSSEPYVLGIRIRLSGNHPEEDICDELAGDYPKDFMWRGWHPRCRCSMSSILMDRNSEEWKHLRSLPENEYKAYQSPNAVKNVPEKFNKWCERNAKKLDLAREKGKLPYFVRDNMKAVGDIIGWEEVKYTLGKGTITIPKYVSSSDNDYKKLIQIAEHFALKGSNVILTPKMKRPPEFEYSKYYKSLIGTKYEGKCPDLNVDGKWYEHEGFVSLNPKNAFRNMMRDGLLQSNRIIIDKPDLTERFMRRSIYNRIKNGEDIEEVWLRYDNGKIEKLFIKTDGQ